MKCVNWLSDLFVTTNENNRAATSQQIDVQRPDKAKGNTGIITTGVYGTLSETPIDWNKYKWFYPQDGQAGHVLSEDSAVRTL